MGDWVGDGMLVGEWMIFAQKSEVGGEEGVKLYKKFPFNKICENLKMLLKK